MAIAKSDFYVELFEEVEEETAKIEPRDALEASVEERARDLVSLITLTGASAHASTYVSHSIHVILHSAGFSKSSSQAIQLLTEVFERYLFLLASTSKHHSSHVGRRLAAPWDVEWSLNELGTSTDDVRRWFDEEGGDIAGRWLESEQHSGVEFASSTLAQQQSIGDMPDSVVDQDIIEHATIRSGAVDFASSTLAQQQSIEDIPEAIVEQEFDGTALWKEQEESQDIFDNDHFALVSEANSMPPSLLTPAGSAFAHVFNQRRGLASLVSDPSKYVPTDTIFACIDARPSAAPFQPGPSLLITPPTTTHSAPTFTPIQASGRELISTSTINNSLYPICKHRNPSNVLNASRFLSGGESGEIFRRVTRTLDPIPILDERHAERVFHGIQAPKEHLSESNSYLREALDVIKVKRADEMKAGIENGSLEEQQSQLSLSTNRDKLRVKNGTLVQTWDWMARDYTDPILPSKKFRSGTPGVFTSNSNGNSNETDRIQDRQRSLSIHQLT